MKCFSKWVSATLAIALLAGVATAADVVSAGKIKSVNADKKEFVLIDAADKEFTFKLGDTVIINRNFKDSQDLKAGDSVKVCYDKGLRTWTAHYILVQEGDTKNCELVRGAVKKYDADNKQLTFTDDAGKDWTFAMGSVKVRLGNKDAKVEDLKIGDKALIIVEQIGDKATLKVLMADRK